MISLKNILKLFPFIILFFLFTLLAWELFYSKPHELPSALIGENVPTFSLPTLYSSSENFTDKNLKEQVTLLNVWATWCYACAIEHDMLMKIKNQYHVPILSINYKDDKAAAKKWLEKNGNPYEMIGVDDTGDVAIDFGVYGTPETFIVNARGKIVYRHIGIIDQKAWDEILYPVIKKYGG